MRRGADRGSIYYVIMPHPYPKLHKSPSNCCVSEIFPPKGDGPLPVVLQYWGNPWDRRSKLHSLSLLTKIGVMSGARSPIRDTTLVRTVFFYLILAKRPRSDSPTLSSYCFYTEN